VAKGVDIEMVPLDEHHVRAKITWSEQDIGGGKLVVEVTVKNTKSRPKTGDQLKSDARALAVRFALAPLGRHQDHREAASLMPLDQGRFRQIPRKAPKQPGFTNAPHSPGRTADFPRAAPPSIWQQSLRQCYPPFKGRW
jgi:hypothetical protein